jgi:hypothetical protein
MTDSMPKQQENSCYQHGFSPVPKLGSLSGIYSQQALTILQGIEQQLHLAGGYPTIEFLPPALLEQIQ